MSTPIRGTQRADWPDQRGSSNTPVEPTERARSALDDPRTLSALAADAAGSVSASARSRNGIGAAITPDADALAASIVAAEAAARARLGLK